MNLRAAVSGPVVGWMRRVNIDPGNCLANATVDVAGVSCPGVTTNDTVIGSCSDTNMQAGLFVAAVIITANDTITIRVANVTAGALNCPAVNVDLLVLRRSLLAQV